MRRSRVLGVVAVAACVGCMPPPVEAVDGWLASYAEGDAPGMVAQTAPEDRPLLERALQVLERAPTSTLAMSLPPRPLDHDIIEIAERSEGRRVVAVELSLANPLPSASRRIGQELRGIPETRTLRRRFLAVEAGAAWGVKLDLARVLERASFAEEALALIARGRLDRASALLAGDLPAPPDDGAGQPGEDRLIAELRRRLDDARARTSTAARGADPRPARALTSTASR